MPASDDGRARLNSSPLVGEEGAREAKPSGKVRGLTRRQRLPALTVFRSRELRQNATEAEKRLWAMLRRTLPAAKFRRQVPLGPYFADFVSHSAKLVVEVDGGQHSEEGDAARTAFLGAEGYRVIRFWNKDVMDNIEGVLTQIAATLTPHPPTSLREAGPSFSHKGRRER
ncbi:endonuclease domain-containing protein [Sphingobium amiense]|uniref:Endonuclease domain-containing protein n=1 Tax=Sphingobium amiense TaxID=135719 RepID=A0A494WEA8_9SPHN|nr:endonuclease domain-containing protein [Sphingobium amiense]